MIIGKLKKIVIAQACRTADRLAENKPCRDFELAIMRAVDRKLQKEAEARAKYFYEMEVIQ